MSSNARGDEPFAHGSGSPRLEAERVIANTLSERDLREFYDPAGLRTAVPLGEFIDDVAATRRPFTLASVGELSGHEVILAEGLHALLDGGEGVALPITADRQIAIADALARYAENVALSVIDVADGLASETAHLQGMLRTGTLRPIPDRVVLAGRVLAAVAHEGGMRRSGRDFFMHPDEVATIVTTAWQRQMTADEDDRLDVVRFLAYGHDGFEDTIDPYGAYLSEKSVLISPLVARRVLEILGIPDARAIARVLLLMTRTKDVDGNKMEYFDYLHRGVREGGILFTLTKAPDIHHNLNIEPDMIERGDRKARAKYEKRETYRAAVDEMRLAGEQFDAATAWIVHSIFAVSPVDIMSTMKSDTVSLQEIAAAVRQKMAERTA